MCLVVDGDMWSYSLYQREIRKSQGNGCVTAALAYQRRQALLQRFCFVGCYESL